MDPAIYTCPMHPEIRERKPGQCPKCGMKLEEKLPPGPRRADPRHGGRAGLSPLR